MESFPVSIKIVVEANLTVESETPEEALSIAEGGVGDANISKMLLGGDGC